MRYTEKHKVVVKCIIKLLKLITNFEFFKEFCDKNSKIRVKKLNSDLHKRRFLIKKDFTTRRSTLPSTIPRFFQLNYDVHCVYVFIPFAFERSVKILFFVSRLEFFCLHACSVPSRPSEYRELSLLSLRR